MADLRIAVLDSDSGFVRVLVKRAADLGWQYRCLEAPPPLDEFVAMRVNAVVVDLAHRVTVMDQGRILAEGTTEPGVVIAEIDIGEVAKARARIPSLEHGRRFEIIEPMAEPTHLHMVPGASAE